MFKFYPAIFFVFALFFSGCDSQQSNRGKDGYRFEEETFVRTGLTVQIVLHSSIKELQAGAPELAGRAVMAYSTLNTQGTETCTLHIVDPKVYYTPEFIGHELVHCIYGQWHRNQP